MQKKSNDKLWFLTESSRDGTLHGIEKSRDHTRSRDQLRLSKYW